ncbi:hypothetical protein QTP86_007433 [Hemibagrus guttatus]|nr:hypothetical protein QTP86_007433 [Hemibagrus guttatus]
MVVCRMTLMVCKKKRSKIEIEKKTKWWKLKKEECCEEFRQKLRQALGGQVVLPDDWETTAEVIRETGRKVLGVSSGRRKEDKETWWWNEEVQDSIQRKRLAKKKWDMDRTEENRQEYKESQRRVKTEVSKAKQKAYDKLYTRLDIREGEKDLYRKISARIKGKVYRTVVRPAMLYGLETVSLRKRQESELEVAELKMLRFSLGVTRLDRIRNEYIRGTAHVGRLGDKVRETRLRWFGHVQRRESPFKPCDALFDSWLVRLGMWLVSLISLLTNVLLMLSVFASPNYLSPVKFIIGSISAANLLTGLCTCVLALIDALTFGEFASYGARWETGAGCRATGFISVAASESSILFLVLAAVQCSVSVSFGKSPSHGSVRCAAAVCVTLSLISASLPLLGVGKFGTTPLCIPSPLPDAPPTTLGFMVALIMMNSLCFLLITSTYIKLYWDLMKGNFDSVWDCAMIKHVAWLIFTNCLLYCPVAFLTFASLLSLIPVSEDVIKSVLLLLLPLPACVNPLLYLLFNPHFREDAKLLLNRARLVQDRVLDSFVSVEMEKSSCDSTQALVPYCSEADATLDGSVPLVPCQLQTTNKENDKKEENVWSKRMDNQRGSSLVSAVYQSSHPTCHS